MKIATYNVWNDNKGMGMRFQQLLKEIQSVDADIIGLQEVTPFFYEKILLQQSGYPYMKFHQYSNEQEGLAVLSRFPFDGSFFLQTLPEYSCSTALCVTFQVAGKHYSCTNLHLPWDSACKKEQQIAEIDRFIHELYQKGKSDVSILLGDFNGSLNSSVHRFLLGEQTLNGREAKPYWFELSSTFAEIHNLPLRPTLDFVRNPRWKGQNSTEIPYPADRIYVMYGSGNDCLRSVNIFGTEVSKENGLAASDHYGVAAEIDFCR